MGMENKDQPRFVDWQGTIGGLSGWLVILLIILFPGYVLLEALKGYTRSCDLWIQQSGLAADMARLINATLGRYIYSFADFVYGKARFESAIYYSLLLWLVVISISVFLVLIYFKLKFKPLRLLFVVFVIAIPISYIWMANQLPVAPLESPEQVLSRMRSDILNKRPINTIHCNRE